MRNILVTGGCGFIGQNFIRQWSEKFPEDVILNFDCLTYAADRSFTEKYFLEIVDISVKDQIIEALKRFKRGVIDLVVHFAAESHVDNSIENSVRFIQSNIIGTHNLLEVFKYYWEHHNPPNPKFIYVSTDEVYGTIDHGFADEFYPLLPNNPYSASKASGDVIARSYYQTYGFPVIITRCCNNFGPYQFPEKFIPVAVSRILENKTIPVYGNGQQIRNWIHVEDHCNAIIQLIKKAVVGKAYNIGSQILLSNIELARKINKILNPDADLVEFVEDRPGHDIRYAIDSTFIRSYIDWAPKYDSLHDFEYALETTVQWYKDNASWVLQCRS